MPVGEFKWYKDGFVWFLYSMIAFIILFGAAAIVYGNHQTNKCIDEGGTPYRSVCLAPGSVIDLD